MSVRSRLGATSLSQRVVIHAHGQLEQLIDAFGTGFDTAGDDEHGRTLVTAGATYDRGVTVELILIAARLGGSW